MPMEFCEFCDNVLYLRENAQRHPEKFCKHCSFTKSESGESALRVAQTTYCDADLLYEQYRNMYLRHDPTLPRIVAPDIQCPNQKCPAHTDKRFIFVKHHASQMKYFFCCEDCGTTFRRETTAA